ncbi:MAG: hypothetical protein ACOC1K_03530 [Nanoarchaeota archaeon]
MKIFNHIREFFWPLLEKDSIKEPEQIKSKDINVDESKLQKTLDYTIKYYEEENTRRKTIEGKSSLFIGTISIITSVILGVTSVLVRANDYNFNILILMLLLFLLTIYMSRTVWFSIKALERKNYYSISLNDFLINDSGDSYYKKLISTIANKARKNSLTINTKVDNMVMAQEYFKRAIVIVVIYSFIIMLFYITNLKIEFYKYFKEFLHSIDILDLSSGIILIFMIISVLSLIISMITIIKK